MGDHLADFQKQRESDQSSRGYRGELIALSLAPWLLEMTENGALQCGAMVGILGQIGHLDWPIRTCIKLLEYHYRKHHADEEGSCNELDR